MSKKTAEFSQSLDDRYEAYEKELNAKARQVKERVLDVSDSLYCKRQVRAELEKKLKEVNEAIRVYELAERLD